MIKKTVYVEVTEGGGKLLTQKLDFVTASEIVQGARLEGKLAAVCNWTQDTTALWYERIRGGAWLVIQVSLPAVGRRHLVNALVPYGVPVPLSGGVIITFAPAVVPQGSADEDPYFTPPDPLGFAKEPNDG